MKFISTYYRQTEEWADAFIAKYSGIAEVSITKTETPDVGIFDVVKTEDIGVLSIPQGDFSATVEGAVISTTTDLVNNKIIITIEDQG